LLLVECHLQQQPLSVSQKGCVRGTQQGRHHLVERLQ
jgi:hypothetical protein